MAPWNSDDLIRVLRIMAVAMTLVLLTIGVMVGWVIGVLL